MNALLALLLLVRLDEEPPPEPPSDCTPLAEIVAAAPVDVRPMPPEAIQPMLLFHNASPPPSTDTFAAAAYASLQNGAGLVLWLRGADVCQRDVIPPPAWARLRPLIEGRAA